MNWIRLPQALKICKENNVKVTRQGLILAGYKNGFIEKDSDGYHFIIKYIQLLTYISTFKQTVEEENKPEEGKEKIKWITVKKASEITKLSTTTLYKMINENELNYKVIGRNRIKYVKRNDVKKIIEKINVNKVLTVKQLKWRYKISLNTIYYHIKRKHFNPIKVKGDKKYYIKMNEIEKVFSNRKSINIRKSKRGMKK